MVRRPPRRTFRARHDGGHSTGAVGARPIATLATASLWIFLVGTFKRRGRDSNSRDPCESTRFPSVPIQPLSHLSLKVGQRVLFTLNFQLYTFHCFYGGEGEIRTLEGLATLPLFESGPVNHLGTSPQEIRDEKVDRIGDFDFSNLASQISNALFAPRKRSEHGGGRIRTYGPLAWTAVFKTAAFGRSATPPNFA